MKKFNFKFEKIYSYKRQILDSEIMVLTSLNDKLTEAEHRLCETEGELQQCISEFEKKIIENVTPLTYRMYGDYIEHLKCKINDEEKKILQINEEINSVLEIIKELKLETKSLETLKAAKYDEYKKDNLKNEEMRMDEFISTSRIMGVTV